MRTQPQPPKRYDVIPTGTVVSFRGLVGAADRNGDRGVVRQYDQSSARYVVELDGEDTTLKVKASNLFQHAHVRLHDIQSQQDLNGKSGTLVVWDESKQRYSVYITVLGRILSLRPSSVIFNKGTVAQITNLQSKPELNGQWGTIQDWIIATNKYDVQLSPQQVIRVKVENMRV